MTQPVGRPTDYKPEYCQEVIELGKAGKSVVQIACTLGYAKQSLYNWEKEFPEFMDAMLLARQYCQMWWEDKGQSGLEADRFQATLWAKQVSCRFPEDYRDKSDLNLGGQKGNPLSVILSDLDGRSSGLPEDKG